jgi:hypothetical protein
MEAAPIQSILHTIVIERQSLETYILPSLAKDDDLDVFLAFCLTTLPHEYMLR